MFSIDTPPTSAGVEVGPAEPGAAAGSGGDGLPAGRLRKGVPPLGPGQRGQRGHRGQRTGSSSHFYGLPIGRDSRHCGAGFEFHGDERGLAWDSGGIWTESSTRSGIFR